MCCSNILCFFGFHKYKPINTLSMPVKLSKHKKIRYTQEQCQRDGCCKIKRVEVYEGKVKKTDKTDIKRCDI